MGERSLPLVAAPIGKPRGGAVGGATGIVGDMVPGAGAENGGPGGITVCVVGPNTVPVVGGTVPVVGGMGPVVGGWVVGPRTVPVVGGCVVPSDGGGIKVASDGATGGGVLPGN